MGTNKVWALTIACNSKYREQGAISLKSGIVILPHLLIEQLEVPAREWGTGHAITLTRMHTSTPEMPTPTCAAWIMLTSLAPSPMARRMDLWCFFTSFTTRAFWIGETRASCAKHEQFSTASVMQSLTTDYGLAHRCKFQKCLRNLTLKTKREAFAICKNDQCYKSIPD